MQLREPDRPVLLRSVLAPAVAERRIREALGVRTRRVTTASVCGYAAGGVLRLEARTPPGGNRFRPVFLGRLEQDADGCALRGTISLAAAPQAAVLVAFALVVGVVFTGGAATVAYFLVVHRRAAALHWLPAVIGPVVLAVFAAALLSSMRRLARADADYLHRWIAQRLESGNVAGR